MSFINFSDTAIRTRPIPERDDRYWLWLAEVEEVVKIQAKLISKGIILRGSITIGDIFIKDNIVFGPGLIDAYRLESQVALYPRIVIDPKVFQDLDDSSSYHEKYKLDLRKLVRQDADGLWYVDYLRSYTLFYTDDDWHDFLSMHRDLIKSEYEKHSKLNSVSAKWNWLAYYHNTTLDRLCDDEPYFFEHLKIMRDLRLSDLGLMYEHWFNE